MIIAFAINVSLICLICMIVSSIKHPCGEGSMILKIVYIVCLVENYNMNEFEDNFFTQI